MKTVILSILGSLLLVNLSHGQFRNRQPARKSNVLLLFSDQHHKRVMGFEGHSDVITPNLDRLAAQAVVFDRAYCTRGICCPSRVSLMTGIMPRTLGLMDNADRSPALNDVVSMASIFKYNGYRTFAFGKRHLSQACVITKDAKLAIMLDPTAAHPDWDFRQFGDMFFDTRNDPLEVDNRIHDAQYKQLILKLRTYYSDFIKHTLATGKQ